MHVLFFKSVPTRKCRPAAGVINATRTPSTKGQQATPANLFPSPTQEVLITFTVSIQTLLITFYISNTGSFDCFYVSSTSSFDYAYVSNAKCLDYIYVTHTRSFDYVYVSKANSFDYAYFSNTISFDVWKCVNSNTTSFRNRPWPAQCECHKLNACTSGSLMCRGRK